jgi:UTP:GlnB (protein PII) uridylyltransferase
MSKNTSQKITILNISSESLRSRTYASTFPEYYALSRITENSLWHDNQNVLNHVIRVFEGSETVLKFEGVINSHKNFINKYLSQLIGSKTRKEILIVATLLHDIAKIDTLVKRPDGTAGCPGHELIAAGRVKLFSERFGLDKDDEHYVERIVRYHGFISEILNLIIMNGNKEKYLKIFKETVGDVALELVLLMHADLLGSDLERGDKKAYDQRIDILSWMFGRLVVEHV